LKYCSECGSTLTDTAKFCSECGFKVKNDLPTISISKDSSTSIKSPHSKVSSFKDTFTSTASKIGEKLTHSKSPIGISFSFNLQNPLHKSETEVNNTTKQTVDPLAKQRELLHKRLEIYRDKLLQIDTRNRSLFLRKIYDKWCFDLSKIINRNLSLEDKITENAILHKRPFCIIPDSENSDLANKDRTKIKSLYRNIIQIERETGRNETYFGFPFLVGHILEAENTDLKYIRGPLILFPITIEYKKTGRPPGWYIVFSKEKKPILNRALFEGIRKIAGITLHQSFVDEFENLMESIEEKKNIEIVRSMTVKRNIASNNEFDTIDNAFFNELYKLLKEYSFPIQSQEKYSNNKVQILEPISQGEVLIMENQNLHLENFKVIGNFPQGETSIYTDYEQLLKKVKDFGESNLGIIDELLETPSVDDVWDEGTGKEQFTELDLDSIPSKDLNLVIESDTSQDSVIIASQSSECTVVRGPPGTGKSQVIVNLISNALANQKKVLVVCQKRAALDVVFQRLEKVQLGKYVALVHDYNTDRSSLYRNLSRILDSEMTNSSDTYALSNKFYQISNEIDTITKIQKKIATSLHKQYFGGISAHKLYTNTKAGYIPKLDLSNLLDKIDYPQLSHLAYMIKTFEADCKKYDYNNYQLFNRKSFSSFDYQDKQKIEEYIDKVIVLLNNSSSSNNNNNIPLLNVTKDNNFKIIFIKDKEEQKALIESLNILINEKGLFKKLKGNWNLAKGNVKKILSIQDNLLEDFDYLQDLIKLSNMGMQLWNDIENFSLFLEKSALNELIELFASKEFKTALYKLMKIKECIDNDFDSLQAYDKRKMDLEPAYRQIFDLFTSKLLNDNNWEEIIKQEFFYAWINYIEKENPILKSQPFDEYIKNRNRLAQLLKYQREIAVIKLIYQLNSNIIKPKTFRRNKRTLQNDNLILWNKLSDDLNKKRRILPIRKLIEIYQSIIFKVSPCWLVSPETVSTIFPLKRNLFDLIIFDEASQSAVEKSLPSLYRGGNIVIMGDEKQLRPFDLFKIQDNEDEYEYSDGEEENIINESLLSESLLVLAKRIYGYQYLTWHYRSKYQELIDFSNKAFYDGNLQVAPNILRSMPHPPIQWIYCDSGFWSDRKNLPEATFVVDKLKEIMIRNRQNGKKQSIGIITFNDSQKDAILDEIENRRRVDIEFDDLYSEAENTENNSLDDIPFVKNIENVQGDERNTIIFSVGYAKDVDGRLHARFGSLNQEGGENRLNVAITRAREEIIIVCSFNPNELRIGDSAHDGPKLLKEYLLYAKYISERNIQSAQTILSNVNADMARIDTKSEKGMLLFDTVFEELVYNKLRSLNYEVDSQVGYSGYKIDLAVVHPDNPKKYILAIECDGASFHSAKSVRERDVVRQEFLEKRGWIIERIWSRNWWRNSDKEIKRIQEQIEKLRNQEINMNELQVTMR
jgi:superfamily I DNA and/or RNA helicase/very-short-patch-repair endonuclease